MMAGRHSIFRAAVLVGDPDKHEAALTEPLLEVAAQTLWAREPSEASRIAASAAAEIVIVTEDVSADTGLDFVQTMKQVHPEILVVMVSASPSVELAVRAVRAGAFDFIAGPLDQDRLRRLAEGLKQQAPQAGGERSRFFCDECPPGVQIVGHGPAIIRVLEMIRLVSESRCNPILLLGETGTGKELAARAVHAWRCGNPEGFVAVNCAALTSNLLESELFGHVKGAFTGADRDKTGLFELAGSGTIYLDEISEMPLELQAKLLRALQEKTFRKVGGVKDICCEATIVASSNQDLFESSRNGRFRQDLYYRLAVFPITMPPLRAEDRKEDIPLLAEYFLGASGVTGRNDIRGFGEPGMRKLLSHDWPGNVRELRNVVERAMILERGDQIGPESLLIERPRADRPGDQDGDGCKPRDANDFSLETAEREFILRALKETGWQRTRAAALLGITRATLHVKLKRYNIQAPAAPGSNEEPAPVENANSRQKGT